MCITDDKTIGKTLERIRLRISNTSLSNFAYEANVDQSQYGKIEKGEIRLTERILQKLREQYGEDSYKVFDGMRLGYFIPNLTVQGSYVHNTSIKSSQDTVEGVFLNKKSDLEGPDYKAKYEMLLEVFKDVLTSVISSNDALKKIQADHSSEGESAEHPRSGSELDRTDSYTPE